MRIVSGGDNLHEMSNPVLFWGKYKKKKNIINLPSAKFAQRVAKVKYMEPLDGFPLARVLF